MPKRLGVLGKYLSAAQHECGLPAKDLEPTARLILICFV
jgi:hypothetical protein